jgi:hypothetical protein
MPRRTLLIGRLQRLEGMGLAAQIAPGRWHLHQDAEAVLRALGERGDIIRTMQRALGRERRELAISGAKMAAAPVIGRVAGKGLADELTDRPYLVIDGLDGRDTTCACPSEPTSPSYLSEASLRWDRHAIARQTGRSSQLPRMASTNRLRILFECKPTPLERVMPRHSLRATSGGWRRCDTRASWSG